MSLSAVLIHRGRLVSTSGTGKVVEGTRLRGGDEFSEWFKCRLFPEETAEQPRGGRRVLVKGPHVVVGPKDFAKARIEPGEITPGKVIEIDAKVLGSQRWTISGDPQVLQPRGNRVLGYYFTVRRLEVAA